MRHEILYLNSRRTYVRVSETWYDTNRYLYPEVNQPFLIGRIEEILSYEEYVNTYPESKDEIYPFVADKTVSTGYLRKVIDKQVKYAVNPIEPQIGRSNLEALG